MIILSIAIDHSPGQAVCLSGYTVRDYERQRISQFETARIPRIRLPTNKDTDRKQLYISFAESECRDDSLCGGKGASLGILHYLAQHQIENEPAAFHVPNGFVLTTNAHQLQMQRRLELNDAAKTIKRVAVGEKTASELSVVCERAVKLFNETILVSEVEKAVHAIFDVLQENFINQGHAKERFQVAVRSSAVGEDSCESSAAGQNDTFLGCNTYDDVCEAVKYCWGSLYSHRSVLYRIQNMQPIKAKMAVVIQTMVQSDVAGVLFTRHPVDKDPYKMLLSANYGLGDTVVSGQVDPDVFTIRRSYQNDELELEEKVLGGKTEALRALPNGNSLYFQAETNKIHIKE